MTAAINESFLNCKTVNCKTDHKDLFICTVKALTIYRLSCITDALLIYLIK
jgi:hypothetical protein